MIAQTTEAEILGRRVQELTARLDEQGRFLADNEFASDRLRNEATSAQKTEAEVRAALAQSENRHRLATEGLRAEKAQSRAVAPFRGRARQAAARDRGMKREAESGWASERVENAVLRERINDVAAEVARLTATLEGPDSPIDAIINNDAQLAPPSTAATTKPCRRSRPMAAKAKAPSPTGSGHCRAGPRPASSRPVERRRDDPPRLT